MSSRKPEIPKRLAGKIRNAQSKIRMLRDNLVHTHQMLFLAESELLEFRSNPETYAADRYPGLTVDSYPIVTRTSRLAEAVMRRKARIELFENELLGLEVQLSTIEAEVLDIVKTMRDSKGRVPWPKVLPSFNGAIERGLKEQRRVIDAAPAERAAYQATIDAWADREQTKLDEIWRREDEKEAERIAHLSFEEREAELAPARAFVKMLKENGLSLPRPFEIKIEVEKDKKGK